MSQQITQEILNTIENQLWVNTMIIKMLVGTCVHFNMVQPKRNVALVCKQAFALTRIITN